MLDNINEQPEYYVLPRQQVELIDKIVEKLKGNTSGTVETESDWQAVILMFELFRIEHPAHFAHFVETMKLYKKETEGTHAIIKDESGDMVQHVLEVPEAFHGYIHQMFPYQKWDRKFTKRLTSELPILRTHNL